MINLSFSAALLLFGGALLSSCTDSGSSTEKKRGTETASTEATTRTVGTRVDSLNGIPGHHFGEPLSAFPGLAVKAPPEHGAQWYFYPDKPEAGWFGNRKKAAPNEFFTAYLFAAGKFVAFSANAYGDQRRELQQEAVYLYGPVTATATGTSWEGEKAHARYGHGQGMLGPSDYFYVESQAFARAQAQSQADQLKKENAGQ